MIKNSLLKIISFYQDFISPNLKKRCRFYPSCSEFSYLAIKKYGVAIGCWKGVKRILRCHSWCRGGVDLP